MTAETKATGGEPVGAGEPEEFDVFFRRTSPRMLARALLIAGHRQDAEDAVQHAYVEALRRWPQVGRYDSPEAWIYLIVKQRLWKAARRLSRQWPVGLEVSRPPAASAEQTAHARAVLGALAALPRRQRQVIVLHCLHGMPQRDIADELGISRVSVAASIHKARSNLEKVLGMTPGAHHREDPLVPAPRPVSPPKLTANADPLTTALRETEAWLRAGVDPQTLARIHAAVVARASGKGKRA